MIIGIRTTGVSASDVRRLIAWATDRAERYYRDRPTDDPMRGLTYLADPIADRIVIVCPDSFGGGPLSCGSASSAYCGWQRSRGLYSYVRLQLRSPGPTVGVWHAYVETPSAQQRIWDPAAEMRGVVHGRG